MKSASSRETGWGTRGRHRAREWLVPSFHAFIDIRSQRLGRGKCNGSMYRITVYAGNWTEQSKCARGKKKPDVIVYRLDYIWNSLLLEMVVRPQPFHFARASHSSTYPMRMALKPIPLIHEHNIHPSIFDNKLFYWTICETRSANICHSFPNQYERTELFYKSEYNRVSLCHIRKSTSARIWIK